MRVKSTSAVKFWSNILRELGNGCIINEAGNVGMYLVAHKCRRRFKVHKKDKNHRDSEEQKTSERADNNNRVKQRPTCS